MGKKQWIGIGFVIVCVLVFIPFFVVESAQRSYIRINNGTSRTTSREVTLSLNGPERVSEMQISNNTEFTDSSWESYKSQKDWELDFGRGTKRVVVKYRLQNGSVERTVYKDTIFLSVLEHMEVSFDITTRDSDTTSDTTSHRNVTLLIDYSPGVEAMRISNSNNFDDVLWQEIDSSVAWTLSSQSGDKKVYIEFRDANNKTEILSQSIEYKERPGVFKDRSIIKGASGSIFYFGVDGALHPFLNSAVYHSWYDDFDNVRTVSDAKLAEFFIGSPVCMRAGTWLLKFEGFPRIYTVEFGCIIRPLYSPIEAYALYGPKWEQRIISLPGNMRFTYRQIDPRTEVLSDTDIDTDRDGVTKEIEEKYGTRDTSADSDGDSISDYEEIYFWFTDPNNADTDGDGFGDGREILAGYSPFDRGALSDFPSASYTYGRGTLVESPDNKTLYFVEVGYLYTPLQNGVRDRSFTSNKLDSQYIIYPQFNITLEPIAPKGVYLLHDHFIVKYPSGSTVDGRVYPL